MSELFNRIELDTWPQQKTRGHTIPGYRYTSAEFFEKEWEHMWTRVWLLLGRESQLPKPGDWQMEEVGRESILMVRQKNGSIKSFYNVCQPRGNPLVDAPKGSTKRFVCRYHSWAFMPDGSLNFAPDKEDFPQGDPCKHVRLQEVACETFAETHRSRVEDCTTRTRFPRHTLSGPEPLRSLLEWRTWLRAYCRQTPTG